MTWWGFWKCTAGMCTSECASNEFNSIQACIPVHVSVWIFYLLLSCILATKPVRGICGVSWTIGGGGGGATDTGAANTQRGRQSRQRVTEAVDREKDNDKRRAKRCDRGDKVQIWERGGENKKKKSLWVSETVQEALLSNSFTHFQSVLFCAALFKLG